MLYVVWFNIFDFYLLVFKSYFCLVLSWWIIGFKWILVMLSLLKRVTFWFVYHVRFLRYKLSLLADSSWSFMKLFRLCRIIYLVRLTYILNRSIFSLTIKVLIMVIKLLRFLITNVIVIKWLIIRLMRTVWSYGSLKRDGFL